MAKTPAERNAELLAKYGIAPSTPSVPEHAPPSIPKPEPSKLVSVTSKALENNKKSLFEVSENDDVNEEYIPPSVPKPISRPVNIPAKVDKEQPKKKIGRPKKQDIITEDTDGGHWFREFLQKIFDPSRKKEPIKYKVAEFKTKYEADVFMKMVPGSEYKAEGFVHKIMFLTEEDSDNDFFSRSKKYGSVMFYWYTKR